MEKLSSPTELIKRSFQLFFEKANFVYFLKIYSFLIPFSLFTLFQNYFISYQFKVLNTTDLTLIISKFPWFLTLIVVVNLILVFVSIWVGVAGIKAVGNVLSNQLMSVKELFTFSRKVMWGFLGVISLTFLAVFGGTILLIVPGVIFGIWFAFSKFVFVDQQLGIKASLGKSRELVKGRFWSVLGRLIVFGLFGLLMQIVFSIIPFNIGSVILPLFGGLLIIPTYLLYVELNTRS